MPTLLFRGRRKLPQAGEVRRPPRAGVWCALGPSGGEKCLDDNTIDNVFYVLRTVRRAAEGEPPRLEGGVPVHRKTCILVASTVSHSPAFPR